MPPDKTRHLDSTSPVVLPEMQTQGECRSEIAHSAGRHAAMMRWGGVVWGLSTDLMTEAKRSKVPHIYVILLMMIGLAAVLTHIVPAGAYARVTDDSGAEILQAGTYSQISSSPASFFDFMCAVPAGLIDTADIVIGIIIIGGMFAVIETAGLIDLAVSRLANVFEDKG